MQTVVQDPPGWCERLALYGFAPNLQTGRLVDADAALPVGTTLAIKDPFLKLGMDGLPLLRVDNPNDVLLLGGSDVLLQGVTWSEEPPHNIKQWMQEAAEKLGSGLDDDEDELSSDQEGTPGSDNKPPGGDQSGGSSGSQPSQPFTPSPAAQRHAGGKARRGKKGKK